MDSGRAPLEVDHLVLGAGPAGLQVAYFLDRAGQDYVVLERGAAPGTFFNTFPRHRRLLSINKVHTGYSDPDTRMRWDWNSLLDHTDLRFSEYSTKYLPDADDLVRYLAAFAARHELDVRFDTDVTMVERGDDQHDRFEVTTADGVMFAAARLVVATGLTHPNVPDVPGVELADTYGEVTTDPDDFVDQRVLVIGKGNSGFETANNLLETAALIHLLSPHSVRFAWQTHFPGHLRSPNDQILETYTLKMQNAVLDAELVRIERQGDELLVTVRYEHADGETETLAYDRVILCTGFRFDHSIFGHGCRPELTIDDRFPAMTPGWESVNVPDLFFAGNLGYALDPAGASSSFIHGFRYNAQALSRLLALRYDDVPWPCEPLDSRPEALARALLDRLNTSSAPWQQFGFIGDVVVFDGQHAMLYPDVPVKYAAATSAFGHDEYLVATLEYGPTTTDPFHVRRHPDPSRAEKSTFLHPVLRLYRDGELAATHHVLEDLYATWRNEETHIRPLVAFLTTCRPAAATGAGQA